MANTYKALAIARQLQNRLSLRIGTKVLGVSFDTDSNPLIYINDGSAATTEKNALIKVAPESWPLAKDVLGSTAFEYTPHVVQLVTEAPASGTGQTFIDLQMLTNIVAECVRVGAKFEWYQSDNGSVPATTDIAAAKLKASFYPEMYYPMMAQQ